MVSIPAILFNIALIGFALFAILAVVALAFAIALLINLYRLSTFAMRGVRRVREGVERARDFVSAFAIDI